MATGSQPSASPSPNQPGAVTGQRIDITGGDNSPVNVTAPFSYAERGGTAHANINETAPASLTPWWSRAAVVWTAVGSLGAVAAVIVAILALGK
jgi:hypothetical protein